MVTNECYASYATFLILRSFHKADAGYILLKSSARSVIGNIESGRWRSQYASAAAQPGAKERFVERPCVGISCAGSDADELCGCIGQHGDSKAIEWRGQPITNRFDIRLFACPAAEESTFALAWWERHDFRSFLRTEELSGNLLHVRDWAYLFQIKTNRTVSGYRNRGKATGMRHVELDMAAILESGFPFRTVAEAKAPRMKIQIASEQAPECAASYHERIT
jgi:hypothetical protein